jgi:hypothetical protein
MPDFCTCGAELPPDARFCHRCGKPQREEIVPETLERPPDVSAAAPPPSATSAGTPQRVNFRNATAVRICFLMAGIASLLSALPAMALGLAGLALWWAGAGFLSVYVYRRRTGQFLTVDSGLRMGGITGLMGSAISVVVSVAMVALIRGGQIATLYDEQFRKMYGSDPKMEQTLKLLEKDPGSLVFGLIFALVFFLFLCMAGGALGAKLVGGVTGPRP